ncbi:hypothetical protein Hanom_Chr06g00551651 [Helianthus anomalus]
MTGSNKLFSDIEILIQNAILENIDKVFKLVEIEKYEIEKFVGKSKKTFYNKSSYKKKNMKARLGYNKNQNQKKHFQKSNY